MSEMKTVFKILRISPDNVGMFRISSRKLSGGFRICSTRAFSLLELVISMAILSIALLGLIQMFPVGLRASKHAGDHTMMTFFGQQKMSDIEQEKPKISTDSNEFFSNPGDEPDYSSFSWRYAVSPDYNNITNLYHATLAIYCNDRGDTRIEEFVTLYYVK